MLGKAGRLGAVITLGGFFGLTAAALPVRADDVPVYTLSIQDHRFVPHTVEIPADTRVKLVVQNKDATPEEFESYELNREVVIPGHSEATVYVGPLSAGEYPFFGEFNQKTAQGTLIAK